MRLPYVAGVRLLPGRLVLTAYALILAFAGLQLMTSAPALAGGVMRRLHRRRADA